MAVISITAANVKGSTSAQRVRQYNAAAATTAGQAVYLSTTTNLWTLLDIDAALTGNGPTDIIGIAENGAPGANQPLVVVIRDDNFTFGGTGTNGLVLYGSTTAGGVSVADIPTTGSYPVALGVLSSTTTMVLRPAASGVII